MNEVKKYDTGMIFFPPIFGRNKKTAKIAV
jgi:hypothetical protein